MVFSFSLEFDTSHSVASAFCEGIVVAQFRFKMECTPKNSFHIDDMIHLERFFNIGTRQYSKLSADSMLPRQYQPDAGEISFFEISIFVLPRQFVECTISNPSLALYQYFIHDDEKMVSFAVHPVVFMVEGLHRPPWLHLLKAAEAQFRMHPVKVVPTASSRTVVPVDLLSHKSERLPQFAIKCHCPVRISRYYRHFESKSIRHAVLMSDELEKIGIPILPETLGISLPRTEEGENGWGFTVREMTPRPIIVNRATKLLPCFSLYGRNAHDSKAEPLLVKLIRHQSKKNAVDFVLDYIMIPIIQNFSKAFLNLGILLEAHGQNVLLEIDANTYEPLRVIHRDFDVVIDSRIRSVKGLQMDTYADVKLENNIDMNQPEENWLSMIYDSSIGHHHFAYLAHVLREYFSVQEILIQERCRKAFVEAFPNHNDYFPGEVCYYGETPIIEDIYPVVSTGKKPVWRPS